MPAGSLEDTQAQAMEHWELIAVARRRPASSPSTPMPPSREPGPRLVDGVELLGHLLHPDLMDPPGNTRFMALRAPMSRPFAPR